jgi:hypothetical protein
VVLIHHDTVEVDGELVEVFQAALSRFTSTWTKCLS